MKNEHIIEVADQRAVTSRLMWLTLHAPAIARDLRPGHYVLVRCSEPDAPHPPLRRALFIAAAEPALGQIGLLYPRDGDAGHGWLTRAHAGDTLNLIGPLGRPISIASRLRTQLLLGEGNGLGALLFAAQQAAARQSEVTLLVAATDQQLLPPSFLLPDALEYQSGIGTALDLLQSADPQQLLRWADSMLAALPPEQIPALRDLVQRMKLRWERGFAHVLIERPLPCATAACGMCSIETRRGPRLLCSQGPALDLRDIA